MILMDKSNWADGSSSEERWGQGILRSEHRKRFFFTNWCITQPTCLPDSRVECDRSWQIGVRRSLVASMPPQRALLEELKAHGIPTGDYNLPDWEETPEGFSRLLTNLFRHTPPTALIIDETCLYIAAAEFLARNRLHVPDQVSLVSAVENTVLSWCHPGIAHMTWDKAPVVRRVVRRVVRWVAAVRKGSADRKTMNVTAKFVPGASIGPVWKG